MKYLIVSLFSVALVLGCAKEPTDVVSLPAKVVVTTEKNVYHLSENVAFNIKNYSGFPLILGFRCGFPHLEMYYQRKENNQWSDTLWFDYMSLRCPTVSDTLAANLPFSSAIPASEFGGVGTYRLLVPVVLQADKDLPELVPGNPFAIR